MEATWAINDGVGTLALGGALTIESAAELKAALLRALDEAPVVALRFEDDARPDVSCVQLLCAAHRSAMRRGTTFALRGPLPATLAAVVGEFAPCVPGAAAGAVCLWEGRGDGCQKRS